MNRLHYSGFNVNADLLLPPPAPSLMLAVLVLTSSGANHVTKDEKDYKSCVGIGAQCILAIRFGRLTIE